MKSTKIYFWRIIWLKKSENPLLEVLWLGIHSQLSESNWVWKVFGTHVGWVWPDEGRCSWRWSQGAPVSKVQGWEVWGMTTGEGAQWAGVLGAQLEVWLWLRKQGEVKWRDLKVTLSHEPWVKTWLTDAMLDGSCTSMQWLRLLYGGAVVGRSGQRRQRPGWGFWTYESLNERVERRRRGICR